MGGRQIRPARVFQTVKEEINHTILGQKSIPKPPWFDIMQKVPPSETLVRNVATQHRKGSRRLTKPKDIFRPQSIKCEEDKLRRRFYRDHPWELARPRIILELDGKDYQHCDWSKGLKQPNIPLTGESVVQYQLWLMRNSDRTVPEAYDYVRHQFYRLRQEEEIEKRVAQEEAKHVGAYFGQTRIDISHGLEDREFENWKIWAGKETERQEQNRNGDIEDFGLEEDVEDIEDTEAEPEAMAEAAEGNKFP